MCRSLLLGRLVLVALAALIVSSGGVFAQNRDLSERNGGLDGRLFVGLPDDDDDDDDDEGSDCATGLLGTGQTTIYAMGDDGAFQAGIPLSYTDNLDGTITDNNTGLMWEKKDDAGGDHDKDDYFDWLEALELVDALNSTMFAGYDDWRLPNVRELQSIMDFGNYGPAVSAEFNANCVAGCTVLDCSCTGSAF